MIACDHVSYEPSSDELPSPPILDDICFEAAEASVTLVRGTSGAGKSTLLSILACVRRPTAGQVLFEGLAVSRYTARHRDELRRVIGFVPQQLHLFDELRAVENVALALMAKGVSRREGASRAVAMLDALHVDSRAQRPVRSLSGGERQRVAVARALVVEPRVVVLDEPTAHQDDERAQLVMQQLQRARERGASVIVAAHDARLDAWNGVDQVLRLTAGRLAGEAR